MLQTLPFVQRLAQNEPIELPVPRTSHRTSYLVNRTS